MDTITDVIDITGNARQIWHIADKLPQDIDLITQSSAYCFSQNKFAIVKNKKKFWVIPGGHIEANEHPKDTVIREVLEEACLEIYDPLFAGYQEIFLPDGSKIYQLRWSARVKNVLDFTADFEIEERKFVLPTEVGNYISWWNNSNGGKAELIQARKLLKS